jgi:tetratricopeptide (TPR) repeat protein
MPQVFGITLPLVFRKSNRTMTPSSLSEIVRAFEEAYLEGNALAASKEEFLAVIHYYRDQDLHTQALEAVEAATERHPAALQWYLLKAQILIELHREDQAVQVLMEAECFEPDATAVDLLKVEAFTYMGRYDEALAILDVLKWSCGEFVPAEIWLAEALVYEYRQAYENMYFALLAALEANPRHTTALERMGLCVELTKRYKESVVLHESILKSDPFCHLAWFNLGQAQAYLGHYEEAIDSFEYAFLIQDDHEAAYLECGDLCLEIGRAAKALQCYTEVLERFEPSAGLFFQIGKSHEILGNYLHATEFFSKALSQEPFDDEVLFHIGRCHAAQKKWKKAIRAFQQAIELDDFREEYHLALADAFAQTGQVMEADEAYSTALSLAPDNPNGILQYARFLLVSGRAEHALQLLEPFNALCDDEPAIHYAYIASLFASGRRAEAVYRASEALEVYPDEAELLWAWVPELKAVAV